MIVRAFLAGLVVLVAGVALLVRSATLYVQAPAAVSSTSGDRVFRLPDGTLGGYGEWAPGWESAAVVVGLVVMVVALAVMAASRASTADSNADAHTR